MGLKPEFVPPEPTTVEQTGPDEFAVHVDSGYRSNVEHEHECGTKFIDYISSRFGIVRTGWMCRKCNTPLDDLRVLDRLLLRVKIYGTLLDMQVMSKEVYVSNGDMGDVVTRHVMRRCVEADDYSEAFIAYAIKGELA